MASCAAVASPRRDGVPPLRPLPRGGLLGAIERLSPRQASQSPARAAAGASPRVTPNKIRTLQDRRPGGAPTGSGAEPPAACSPLAAAEAHERLVGAVCEAVREAAREEVREQMREATGALQDAVRSEVSLALRASPGAGSGRQAVLFARKPGGDVHMPPLKYTSGELQAGLIREDSTRDSPVSGTSKKVTSSHHTFWSEERAKHLSSFAERQGRTEVIETGPAIKWIERLNYWWKLKEPKRHGKLADLFDNDWFEVSVQVIIMLNCVFMAIVANSEVANLDEDPHPIILPLEIAFQVIYTIELVAKLYVHRLYFFWNEDSALNILDFTLVFTGALDIALRLSNLWNVTYFRSLRVVKVAKALRLVRVITGAVQLRNIFICIIGSLMNLIWSIVMLAVVLYMFSLGMVISAATHLQEMGEGTTDSAESLREDLLSMYGSVQQSMLTLYQATTGGEDWSVSFDTISSTGWVASVVYLMFVSFMHIWFAANWHLRGHGPREARPRPGGHGPEPSQGGGVGGRGAACSVEGGGRGRRLSFGRGLPRRHYWGQNTSPASAHGALRRQRQPVLWRPVEGLGGRQCAHKQLRGRLYAAEGLGLQLRHPGAAVGGIRHRQKGRPRGVGADSRVGFQRGPRKPGPRRSPSLPSLAGGCARLCCAWRAGYSKSSAQQLFRIVAPAAMPP
ncbi:unnamed protein product [Prorocentrum cordatum]|uniref:Ion transport domain-containing protein n=1 Tax=Prorocentrum cordatum TaxID=2364126 RepID=A0ABN9QRT2_9DINO|nr:unnamed protein product [Polarella glacialis]